MSWDFGLFDGKQATFYDKEGKSKGSRPVEGDTNDFLSSLDAEVNFVDRPLGDEGLYLLLSNDWFFEPSEEKRKELAATIKEALRNSNLGSDKNLGWVEWILGLVRPPISTSDEIEDAPLTPLPRGSPHAEISASAISLKVGQNRDDLLGGMHFISQLKEDCAGNLYMLRAREARTEKSLREIELLDDAYSKYSKKYRWLRNSLTLMDWEGEHDISDIIKIWEKLDEINKGIMMTELQNTDLRGFTHQSFLDHLRKEYRIELEKEE